MGYLQAENMKQKRTFAKKLMVLAPVITALINIFAPLWYQINSYNWWYILLYPGFLTLVCALIEQRDNGKLKYRAVFTLPVNLNKVWKAKIGVAGIYVSTGNLVFLILNLFGGYIILAVHEIPLTVSILQAISGTVCIVIVSLWEIPLCLWFSQKIGIFMTVVLNVGVGSILGIFASTSELWFLCPYSWIPHLMIPVLKIMPNGMPATMKNTLHTYWEIFFTLLLSVIIFVLLSFVTVKDFEKRR